MVRLSDEIKAEIRAIKKELKPLDREETPRPKPLPPQYCLNRYVKRVTKEDKRSTMAALVNSLKLLSMVDTFFDDDTSSDDDDTRMGCIVVSVRNKLKFKST